MGDKKAFSKDAVKEQQMWKAYIQGQDESSHIWKQNWGWLLEEYKCLKKKLDEKTEHSTFLAAVKEEVIEDNRQLSRLPESTNHLYGWVAKEEDFKLDRYGSDYFKAQPLPDIYKVTK